MMHQTLGDAIAALVRDLQTCELEGFSASQLALTETEAEQLAARLINTLELGYSMDGDELSSNLEYVRAQRDSKPKTQRGSMTTNPSNSDFFILATLFGFQAMQGDPDDHNTWIATLDSTELLLPQPTAIAMAEQINHYLESRQRHQTQCRIVVQMSNTIIAAAIPTCQPTWLPTGKLITNCQSLIERTS